MWRGFVLEYVLVKLLLPVGPRGLGCALFGADRVLHAWSPGWERDRPKQDTSACEHCLTVHDADSRAWENVADSINMFCLRENVAAGAESRYSNLFSGFAHAADPCQKERLMWCLIPSRIRA